MIGSSSFLLQSLGSQHPYIIMDHNTDDNDNQNHPFLTSSEHAEQISNQQIEESLLRSEGHVDGLLSTSQGNEGVRSPRRSLLPRKTNSTSLDVIVKGVGEASASIPKRNAEVDSSTAIFRSSHVQKSGENSRKNKKDEGIKIGKKERKSSPQVIRFRRFKPSMVPDPNLPPTCTECNREFSSRPALYGHMRTHPERDWRGIVPPPNVVTPPILVPREDVEVATGLLLLSFDKRGVLLNSEDNIIEEQEQPIRSASSSNARFKCKVCKTVFPTYQALGGHRASHKSVKGCFAIDKSVEGQNSERNSDIMNDNNVRDRDRIMAGLGTIHQCQICLRIFASRQALGGHMRGHSERVEEATFAQGRANLTGTSLGRHGLVVDLNLPPPPHLLIENDEDSSSSSSSPDTDLHL